MPQAIRRNSPAPVAQAATRSPALSGGLLTLASYNVHSCIGTDRRFDPARIAEAVTGFDADIVALQELGWHHRGLRHFDQFDYLGRQTGYHVVEAPTKFHARAHYGNALLLRDRAFEHRLIDLSAPFEIPRGCVIARLDFDGAPLTVFNAHLGLTPWERRRQARRLAHEFEQTEGEIILVGDFNSWHHGCAMSRVFAERLPRVTDMATFHARAPRLPFDRIYLSAGLDFESIEVIRTGPALLASDHLPLRARIRRRAVDKAFTAATG